MFHAEPGERFDESQVAGYPKGTAYERSKQRAEQLALSERDGLEVVIVNPAGVYGPGPSASVSFDQGFFEPLVRRRLPALPPGGLGLVYVDGAGAGTPAGGRARARRRALHPVRHAHVAARPGATRWCARPGRGWVPPTLPLPLARAMAAGSEALSRVIRRPPLLSRGQLYFFTWNAHPVAAKAETELGWTSTPLAEGLRRTLADLGSELGRQLAQPDRARHAVPVARPDRSPGSVPRAGPGRDGCAPCRSAAAPRRG